MQHLINIHFTSPSLARALRDARSGSGGAAAMLYFVFNPDVVAAVVAHDLRGDGEFVAQVPFFPPFQTLEEDFTREKCARLSVPPHGIPRTNPAGVPTSTPSPTSSCGASVDGPCRRRWRTRFIGVGWRCAETPRTDFPPREVSG